MKMHAGFAFPDADRFMVDETKHDGTYQAANLRAALRFVTDFSVGIDGGAHVGTWSKLMADAFQKVIAFEPSTDTFECLLFNMKSIEHVDCQPYALGAVPGRVRMALDAANEARANTGARHVDAGGDIQVITIDSLNLRSCGFIKLDIEGSEPMALEGAADTIKRCRPIVLFENKKLWTRHFGMPADVVDRILRGYGYRHLATVSCDQIWGPR
jgi:FkbM family methyltransferase